ncbi:MAG: hypothetical protein QOJ42_2264 [Acidobacteriaceae bacterium]|jgi:tripartite-type tricarboxylate transporter receptor subunit TctC|nr:hypothetical protein [Acidobacteriaceae bacterium]
MNTIVKAALAYAVWSALAVTSASADYPTKPIRLIVPSAVGGAPDTIGRLIASELGKQMGQQVVVDNRPGASGVIGFEALAKAAADGYTFGYATFPFIINPIIFSKLPYDAAKDFHPVVLQGFGASLMTVTPALQVRSARELIAYARAQPGQLSYGSSGSGSSQQLAVELFKFMTGTQIVQVSYKGIQQAITEVIAGQIHIVCDAPTSVLPHIRAGRLRAIGVTTPRRLRSMPDVPTVAESGLPGYEVQLSSGYLVPAGAPRSVVMRLNTEINKALASPVLLEKFASASYMVAGGTPDQFAEHLRRETVKWTGVIKAAGVKPQ